MTPRRDPAPLPIILTSGQALSHYLVSPLAAVLDFSADTVAVAHVVVHRGPDERAPVVPVVASHGYDTILRHHGVGAPNFYNIKQTNFFKIIISIYKFVTNYYPKLFIIDY